jgi:3-oxoacyl-[acyl-carrier-protein] synthase-3
MNAYIKGISYYLPESTITNEDLARLYPEWSIEKIQSKTGIYTRHIAAEDEFSSDMGFKAAQQLFSEYHIDPLEIDFLIFCTQSPDYLLPTTACILQERLGLSTTTGALDFNLGCSGYIYGLALAKGLIMSGVAKNILFITSETYSKFINPGDKSNRTIFGDGASATLISIDGFCSIEQFSVGTDGKGANNLIVKEGGTRYPVRSFSQHKDSLGNVTSPSCLYMNGPEIFSFTSTAVPSLIEDVLAKNDLSKESIDLFIFHQANQFMLEHLRKKIGIPSDKFFIHIENCGNTVSSTIPIALKEAIDAGRIKKGYKCLLAGFGVGYSWAGTVLRF